MTLFALQLEPINMLSVIGQRTKAHSRINYSVARCSDLHCNPKKISQQRKKRPES